MNGPHTPISDAWGGYFSGFDKLGIFRANTYGLGWVLSEFQGRKIIHHAGGGMGYRSFTCILPEEGLGIVVLMNLGGVYSDTLAPEALAFRIIDEHLGRAQRDWSTEFYDDVWEE